eukprot:GCRY01006137.1.p1 GENE.GCRY01006137.1~~GCRY01006137.1.p1  ORF type:complete len:671 (+),score=103.31 GCRY01006137.1:629-2641(+)
MRNENAVRNSEEVGSSGFWTGRSTSTYSNASARGSRRSIESGSRVARHQAVGNWSVLKMALGQSDRLSEIQGTQKRHHHRKQNLTPEQKEEKKIVGLVADAITTLLSCSRPPLNKAPQSSLTYSSVMLASENASQPALQPQTYPTFPLASQTLEQNREASVSHSPTEINTTISGNDIGRLPGSMCPEREPSFTASGTFAPIPKSVATARPLGLASAYPNFSVLWERARQCGETVISPMWKAFPLNIRRLLSECHKKSTTPPLSIVLAQLEEIHNVVKLEAMVELKMEEVVEAQKKMTTLLNNLIPPTVAAQLKTGKEVKAKQYENVTVFFSDISGFTAMSTKVSAELLLNMLDRLFRIYDSLTAENHMYKVETIGDGWFGVCGCPLKNSLNALYSVRFAHKILENLRNFYTPLGNVVQLRIGLHSGEVMAGLLGDLKCAPHFCLVGKTVNKASRMESSGLPDKVHISLETKQQIHLQISAQRKRYAKVSKNQWPVPEAEGWEIDSRGTRDVKGLGTVETYFVNPENAMNNVIEFEKENGDQQHPISGSNSYGSLVPNSTPTPQNSHIRLCRDERSNEMGSESSQDTIKGESWQSKPQTGSFHQLTLEDDDTPIGFEPEPISTLTEIPNAEPKENKVSMAHSLSIHQAMEALLPNEQTLEATQTKTERTNN